MATTYRIHWTGDEYADAVIVADRLREQGKNAGVAKVAEWNLQHREQVVRTANRYLVFIQTTRA